MFVMLVSHTYGLSSSISGWPCAAGGLALVRLHLHISTNPRFANLERNPYRLTSEYFTHAPDFSLNPSGVHAV